MIPSKKALEEAFKFYNTKYFHNQLPMPKFQIGCDEGYLGQFEPSPDLRVKGGRIINIPKPPGILSITSQYDRSEKGILTTLLHEMVHMYVLCVKRVYERANEGHGNIFTAKAQEINADGWNIMNENDLEDGDSIADGVQQSDTWNDGYVGQTGGQPQQQQQGPQQQGPQQQGPQQQMPQQNVNLDPNVLQSILQQLIALNNLITQYMQMNNGQ